MSLFMTSSPFTTESGLEAESLESSFVPVMVEPLESSFDFPLMKDVASSSDTNSDKNQNRYLFRYKMKPMI